MHVVPRVKYHGAMFKIYQVIILEIDKDENIVFGKINMIIVDKNHSVNFVVQVLKTVGFELHIKAYKIVLSNEYKIVNLTNELIPSNVHVTGDEFQCIPLYNLL